MAQITPGKISSRPDLRPLVAETKNRLRQVASCPGALTGTVARSSPTDTLSGFCAADPGLHIGIRG